MRTCDLFRIGRGCRHWWSPESWKAPDLSPPPDKQTFCYAVDRAATIRRRRYQDNDRYKHYSENALLEQVCGVERDPVDVGDGWWLIGRVVDALAHIELEVVCRPGQTIRLSEIVEPVVEKEPPGWKTLCFSDFPLVAPQGFEP